MYNNRSVAIKFTGIGKMYKLYKKMGDKYRDAFGLNFFKKDYYKEFWALRDITLTIRAGERVGFIGHNGAGKSTLLKTLIGRISPTEGSITVEGNIQALLELGTGFHPEFTGKENIRASLMMNNCTEKQINQLMDDIIEFAELEEYIDQPVKTYSAGMYARLAFSTATAIEPEILIIDEILGAGDAYFTGKCVERMRTLTKESDATVLFVSHDLGSVQAICDRVIWIDKGRIRYDGDTLTALKLYSQSVRENDELRIKIRDMKVSKKQALLLDRDQDLYNTVLFHFIPKDALTFGGKVKIRTLRLIGPDGELASIEVGGPMDNDESAKNLILDDPVYMCWGKSDRDKQGFYRTYLKKGGRYKHAPFQFKYSKQFSSLNGLSLAVEADVDAGSELFVEFLNTDGSFIQCGEIAGGQKFEYPLGNSEVASVSEQTSLPEEVVAENPPDELLIPVRLDYRETPACSIVSANIYPKTGEARRVFAFEEPIDRFAFVFRFGEPRSHFIFTFLIYTAKGDLALNICERVLMNNPTKTVSLNINMEDIRIGTGEYVITFAIYDELNVMDNSIEAPVLTVIDRAMGFKINQPLNYMANVGIVLPKLKYRIEMDPSGGYVCSSLL